jgi:hypothetical protein
MTRITNKPTPKLRKAPQPPLSHPGATADADRAKRPPLVQSRASDSEVNPGDRVEGLADFGKPTGEFGTVEKTNEDDALVKWDDDGRTRLRQPSLKTVSKKAHAPGKAARTCQVMRRVPTRDPLDLALPVNKVCHFHP